MRTIGIKTIGDLAIAPVDLLVQHFGKHYGQWMAEAANGRDERPVVTESEPKSISRETTFERDLDPHRDRDALSRILLSLCQSISHDLNRQGYLSKTIGVKLRYQDFRTVTRDKTLASPIDQPQTILGTARDCLKRVPVDRKLRLLGVRAASLVRSAPADHFPPDVPKEDDSDTRKNLRLFD